MPKIIKKTVKPKKIDTAIIVALITLVGVIITAILTSPNLNILFEKLSTGTGLNNNQEKNLTLTATSQDMVEMKFRLPSDSEPATVKINNDGVTVLEIHVLPDTEQIVRLPPGDYMFVIESDYVHMANPCFNIIQFDMIPFTVDDNGLKSIPLPSMGRAVPIPNCTPSP